MENIAKVHGKKIEKTSKNNGKNGNNIIKK